MSYILDALTKLDQDRQRARAADLYPPHETTGAAHDHPSRWFYLLGGALLAVIVIAPSFHFWNKTRVNEPHSKVQSAPTKPEVAAERRREAAAPAMSGVGSENLPLTLDQLRARELPPAAPVEPTRARPVEQTPAPPIEQSPPRSVAQTSARPSPAKRDSPKAATEATPPAVTRATSRPPARVRASAGAAKSEAAEAPPKKMGQARTAQSAAERNELPASMQEDMPKVSVSGFAYSDDPKARVAFVNGQMLAEGDEVAGGLKVEGILRDGVVFSYKGRRFRRGGPGSAN